jgi:hypothetical protein
MLQKYLPSFIFYKKPIFNKKPRIDQVGGLLNKNQEFNGGECVEDELNLIKDA